MQLDYFVQAISLVASTAQVASNDVRVWSNFSVVKKTHHSSIVCMIVIDDYLTRISIQQMGNNVSLTAS